MPTGQIRHHIHILRDVHAFAERFNEAAHEAGNYGSWQMMPADQLEVAVAEWGIRLDWALNELNEAAAASPSRLLKRSCEREVKRLRKLLMARLERWGWSYLIQPGGPEASAAKLKRHDAKRVAYMDAVLSWRSSDDPTPCPGADGDADRAEEEGITPTMTPEEGKQAWEGLRRRWYSDPVLSESRPTITPADYHEFATSMPQIRLYLQFNRPPAEIPEGLPPLVVKPEPTPPDMIRALEVAIKRRAERPTPEAIDPVPPTPATTATPPLAPVTAEPVPLPLDSLAVGHAHAMLNKSEGINVSEIARRLGVERTKLYDLTGFRAILEQERKDREAAKQRRPRGRKDRDTRTVEAWSPDE